MILDLKEIEKIYNWRQICFQYPQFCVHCGGFVEPGQNGSWNVSTKEVHHETCPNYREIPENRLKTNFSTSISVSENSNFKPSWYSVPWWTVNGGKYVEDKK